MPVSKFVVWTETIFPFLWEANERNAIGTRYWPASVANAALFDVHLPPLVHLSP